MKSLAVRILLPLSASICLGWPLRDQSPANKDSKVPDSKKVESSAAAEQRLRIDNLIILTQGAPAEVTGDLLLTLVSSNLIVNKERKIELIEQAFRTAAEMREHVRRKSWSRQVDTRSGLMQRAFDFELDKLSTQSKAVIKMIPLDRLRARTMFESISLPLIRPLTCEDSLGYDLDAYYVAMLTVAEECFDDEERKAEAHIRFTSDRLESIRSISQVTPAIRMLNNAKLSPDELSLLVSVLSKALGRVATDGRAFAFAMERDPLVSTAHRLVLKLKQQGVPTNDLVGAFRSFLIKNMSGEVCADVGWIKGGQISLPADVVRINNDFASPIAVDDVHPASFGPKAADIEYWTTPKAAELLWIAKQLRFGGGETALSVEQRQTEEWHRKLVDFLELIENWGPESESSSNDYFQQKCITYMVLVDLCPDDPQRDVVLRAYGNYLKETSREYKGRIEWILPVKDYLRVLKSKSDKIRRSSLDPWLTSSDGNLRIYGELAMLPSSKN
jgi:hypothetical protein